MSSTLLLPLLCAVFVPLVASQGVHFNCPALPPLTQPAKTVYELKPQDIKVVMALGDSITAGFGMMGAQGNLYNDSLEYRGQSWSMGGDSNAQSVAAFLRFYTPNITGASVGYHIVEMCYGLLCPPFQYEPKKDVFNAAQSGAMMPNLVTHEFSYLIDQVRSNPNVDIQNDWKLLTIFIGTNDLCLGCSGDFPDLTADEYQKHMNETIAEIKKNLPRTFVNLVLLGNISEIYRASLQSSRCMEIHRDASFECRCAFTSGDEGDKLRRELDDMIQEYNERSRKVAAWWAGQKYDDFAVVVQPFYSQANLTLDFLSTLDCFHPSLVAHQNMARGLWNNMLTPAAKKRTSFNTTEPFVCPTNTTLLYSN